MIGCTGKSKHMTGGGLETQRCAVIKTNSCLCITIHQRCAQRCMMIQRCHTSKSSQAFGVQGAKWKVHQFTGGVTGRSTERPVLSEEEIERNVTGIKRILEQLISSSNGAGPAPQILNNLVHASTHHAWHTHESWAAPAPFLVACTLLSSEPEPATTEGATAAQLLSRTRSLMTVFLRVAQAEVCAGSQVKQHPKRDLKLLAMHRTGSRGWGCSPSYGTWASMPERAPLHMCRHQSSCPHSQEPSPVG